MDEDWNIAPLALSTHRALHALEHTDRELYNEINKDLLEIDRARPVSREKQKTLYKKLYGVK